MTEWSNWSGRVRCTPESVLVARAEEEIAERLRSDPASPVRVVGSGHSFTSLCATPGLLMDLSRLSGVVEVDESAHRATVWAGTTISDLGPLLRARGLALANQGDIDRQAIAGAISTATHGTGRELGSLSTQVVGMRVLTADGGVRDIDETEADVLRAARVSLGSLGVVTQVTLQLLPAYKLHEQMAHVPLDECLEELEEKVARHRHFEFFYSPHHRSCATKSLDVTDRADFQSEDWSSESFRGERSGWSHVVFPSDRERKFNETEWALPREAGPECLRELVQLVHRDHPDMKWPFEYRTVAADDAFLSPFHDRESVTIAAHQGAELDERAFFHDVQTILKRYGGRPHWGKLHALTPDELAGHYPKWDAFHAVRAELDPGGRFLNDHLRRIFGIPSDV